MGMLPTKPRLQRLSGESIESNKIIQKNHFYYIILYSNMCRLYFIQKCPKSCYFQYYPPKPALGLRFKVTWSCYCRVTDVTFEFTAHSTAFPMLPNILIASDAVSGKIEQLNAVFFDPDLRGRPTGRGVINVLPMMFLF